MSMRFQSKLCLVDFEREILRLKADSDAVILSHYYQDSEIQDMSDFIGDSLELIRYSLSSAAKVIIFSGTRFVAESLAVLNPTKKVIIPDYDAGCSLNESCSLEELMQYKTENPDSILVTHINSSLEVKAISDFVVTPTDAEAVIASIPEDKQILFVPDKNLGHYLMNHMGRDMKLWNGVCVVHNNFCERELVKIKTTNPKAKIIANPMCNHVLLEYAEYVGFDSDLLDYAIRFDGAEFIVLAEPGIIHQMHIKAPNSKFYDVPVLDSGKKTCSSECPYMRKNNIENLYAALLGDGYNVKIPKDLELKLHKLHARFLS